MPKIITQESRIAVKTMISLGFSASRIAELLKSESKLPVPPSERSIQRILSEMRQADDGRQWNWQEEEPEVVGVVLDTLARIVTFTDGRIQAVSEKDANHIYRLRIAYPDLPAEMAYMLASAMDERTGKDDRIDSITGYLMYTPWRSDEDLARYREAITYGWVVGEPPTAVILHDDGELEIVNFIEAIKYFVPPDNEGGKDVGEHILMNP